MRVVKITSAGTLDVVLDKLTTIMSSDHAQGSIGLKIERTQCVLEPILLADGRICRFWSHEFGHVDIRNDR